MALGQILEYLEQWMHKYALGSFANMNLGSWAFGKRERAEFKGHQCSKHLGYSGYYVGQIHALGQPMGQQIESRSYRNTATIHPNRNVRYGFRYPIGLVGFRAPIFRTRIFLRKLSYVCSNTEVWSLSVSFHITAWS